MQKDRPVVDIRPAFFLGVSLAVLLIPVRLVVAWLSAVVIHELFHLSAIRVCSHHVDRIVFDISGARIETDELSPLQEFFCALAGPLSGFLLLLVIRIIPELAICGVILSVCNLLPLYPMDGGRILHSVLRNLLPPNKSVCVQRIVELGCLGVLTVLGVYLSLCILFSPLPLAVVAVICFRNKRIKFPCKVSRRRVQYTQLIQKRDHNERTTTAYTAVGSETCPLYRR